MKPQLLKCATLAVFGFLNLVAAQQLTARPFPTLPDGKITVSGEGFAANSQVGLAFNAPKPTKLDDSAAPTSAKTDAQGAFSLVLKIGNRLSMSARAGNKSVDLKLEPPALTVAPTLVVKGDSLEASRNGSPVWTARLHPRPGVKLDPVKLGQDIFVPDGASVMQLEPQKGAVVQRFVVSGLVSSLESRGAEIRVNVEIPGSGSKLTEAFTLRRAVGQPNYALLERPVYQPDAILLETFEDFAAKASQGNQLKPNFPEVSQQTNANYALADPTNPFYKIFEGAAWQAQNKPTEANLAYSQALNTVVPFFVYIREAAMFERLKANNGDFADQALKFARNAYGNAGYDPAIPVSSKALEAYGNPLGVARSLFDAKDFVRGTVWLSFLRDTMPHFENSETVFLEMAKYLDDQVQPSAEWRMAQREVAQGTPYAFGISRILIFSLGGLLALMGAFVALWLVLAAKYAAQQARDLKNVGGAMGAWARAPLMRLRHSLSAYLTLTEKIVLVTLLVLMVGALGTWTWSTRALETLRHPALNLGTLGGVSFWNSFATKPSSPDFDAIRGLASLLDGDKTRAAGFLEAATDNPMALNNLGVLATERGDRARAAQNFQSALVLKPAMIEASLNSGASPAGSYRLNFHNAVSPASPMLAFPEPKDVVQASQGKLESEFAGMVADPWGYLNHLPLGLPTWGLNIVAVVILGILALNLLSLLIPRVPSARAAPRNLLYHVMALLVPGSGLADEVWGIILLVPWALAGGVLLIFFNRPDLVPSILENQKILGISSVPAVLDLGSYSLWVIGGLAVLYLINFIGWLLETIAWNKKMRVLAEIAAKQTQASPVQAP
jgi:tetratricopeptide (TPR) repeat protein